MGDYSSTKTVQGNWTEGVQTIADTINGFLTMKNNMEEKKQKREMQDLQMQQMRMQIAGQQKSMQEQEAMTNEIKSIPATKRVPVAPEELPVDFEDMKSAYTPEKLQEMTTREVPRSLLEKIDDVAAVHLKYGIDKMNPAQLAQLRNSLLEKQKGSISQQADAKYDDIQTKITMGEDVSSFDYAWAKAYEKRKTLSADAYGKQRMNIMLASPTSVIDANGNLTIVPKGQSYGQLPAVQGSREMARTSLFEDIKGASSNVKNSLANMQEFTTAQRAQLAIVMSAPDPHSSWNMWMKSNIATTLSKEQIDYVTDLLQLKENAYALRPILGAGQGSDELRAAIAQTLPSALSGDKAMAAKSLDKFDQQITRLRRGLPNVRIQPEEPKQKVMSESDARKALAAKGLVGPNMEKWIKIYKDQGVVK